jgi:hypothetical protein
MRYNTESYEKAVREVNPSLTVLDSYKTVTTPIRHRCCACAQEWTTQPRTVLRGAKCIHCFHKDQTDTASSYQMKLDKLHTGLKLIDKYRGSRRLSLHEHTCCGEQRLTRPDTALKVGKLLKCPVCRPRVAPTYWSKRATHAGEEFHSHLEADSFAILLEHFTRDEIVLQKLYRPNRRLTADFYIVPLDLYIEVSSIKKTWYYERIFKKSLLVKNFFFASDLQQLRQFLSDIIRDH